MVVLEIFSAWIHILCAVGFLGTMFIGTFVLLPVLRAHLDYEHRQQFITNFIPRARIFVGSFISLLVLSGIVRAFLLHDVDVGEMNGMRSGVFISHVFFAVVPVMIFLLAPRILGVHSQQGLCCDPDADDPPIFMGVMTTKGAVLHYIAIAAGWTAVLCGVVMNHMRMT
jgi:hypothetical protein